MKKLFIIPANDGESITAGKMLARTGAKYVQLFNTPRIEAVKAEFGTEFITVTPDEITEDGTYFTTSQQMWGASFEKMEPEIMNFASQFQNVVAMEFKVEDYKLPKNIKMIDHHWYSPTEDHRKNPSSIEQLAEILGVELTIFEKFVAKNDVGHIEAMSEYAKSLNMSDDETRKLIEEVRELEYFGQQIPHEARIAAEVAIKEAYVFDNRLNIIEVENMAEQTIVVDMLHKMGKYKKMGFDTTVVISSGDNGRIVVFSGKDNVEFLKNEYISKKEELNLTAVWTGGTEKYGFFGLQFNKDAEQEAKEALAKTVSRELSEKILGYERMVEKEDILMSEKLSDTVHIHEINNPEVFFRTISEAKKSPYGPFVHLYSVEEYEEKMKKGGKAFIVNAGAAGFFVTAEGDIVSVFKNDKIAEADFLEKATNFILVKALKEGGVSLDCFEGFLPNLYSKFGFIPLKKTRFSKEFQPDGWKEEFGQPDIVFMVHNGDSIEEVLRRQKEDPYPKYDGSTVEYAESYDEAVNEVKEYLKNQKVVQNEYTSSENKITFK